MSVMRCYLILSSVVLCLAGCAADHSPDVYAANAVQQANKVEPAVVAGYRQVSISASGTVGAVTGGAVGGILGSARSGATEVGSALGGVGGGVIGSLLGSSLERVTGDTTGWEYIVRKANGELLSVTQREPKPLPVGQKVLVITGNQARIVPDYSNGEASAQADSGKTPAQADPGKTSAQAAPAQLTPAPAAAAPIPVAPPPLAAPVAAPVAAATLPRATQD